MERDSKPERDRGSDRCGGRVDWKAEPSADPRNDEGDGPEKTSVEEADECHREHQAGKRHHGRIVVKKPHAELGHSAEGCRRERPSERH